MSSLYLIRHGQAGKRQHYDELSDIGRRQALLLGEYFAARPPFTKIYSGALHRQRQTAELVASACRERPAIAVVPQWNEFDLDEVYKGMAPQLCAEDAEFKQQYQELQAAMADESSPVHRTWSKCDTTVVRAWVQGRYAFEGETFAAFRGRVQGSLEQLQRLGPDDSAAIFTSATPIAVWIGMALDLEPARIMQLAGVMYNSAITVLRLRPSGLRLHSFNGVPHLADPSLWSFR